MPSARSIWTAMCLALAISLVTASAFADALVVVRVRGEGAPDGRVTLVPARGNGSYSCQTRGGTCRIEGVPGGQYTVRFEPTGAPAPAPARAMIPPAGTVTLHVAAR